MIAKSAWPARPQLPRFCCLALALATIVGCERPTTNLSPDARTEEDAGPLPFDSGMESDGQDAIDAMDSSAGADSGDAAHDAAEAPDTGGPMDDGGATEMGGACLLASGSSATPMAMAACSAVRAFERGDFASPFDLLLGDVSARRFQVPELSGLWGRYQTALQQDPSVELRTYARVADAAAQVTAGDLQALRGLDEYTGPALHCRDHALPSGYAESLANKLAAGGYDTSHVLLALMWIRDAGCQNPTDGDFYEAALTATAGLIDTDHQVTNDLEIEAATFLAYLGEGARIPTGFASAVIANQQPSGVWSELDPSGQPNGHTTGLALWYLHELLFPGRTGTMVNPDVR